MPVAIKDTGSPLGALLGLGLIIAMPLMLVAIQLTLRGKVAVTETMSDPVAEWYFPAASRVVIDHRIAVASPEAPVRGRGVLD
jgi:hypothetical protein